MSMDEKVKSFNKSFSATNNGSLTRLTKSFKCDEKVQNMSIFKTALMWNRIG